MSADTIVHCFKHCGVQPRADEATDPFADLDEESEDEQERDERLQDEELQQLVQQFDPQLNACDYVYADEDLPTCDTYDSMNENWRDVLREQVLSGGSAKKQAVSESESEEDESDEELPSTINCKCVLSMILYVHYGNYDEYVYHSVIKRPPRYNSQIDLAQGDRYKEVPLYKK